MSIDWNAIAQQDDHRPWPTPSRRWVMTMSWVDLLFAHWPVDPAKLEPHIPEGLTLDLYEGEAWVSLVPFEMDNTMVRGLTWWPRPMQFAELNLRTYVTAQGETSDKPGVWFFSLDAASRLAVAGARASFHLPYFNAKMSIERDGEWLEYDSRRTHRGEPPVEFSGRYRPAGPIEKAEVGSLDHWLFERYCLYSADSSGTVYRADVNHAPWPLRPVEVDIDQNTIGEPVGIEMAGRPPRMQFVDQLDVVGWLPEKLA
ncbi:MAG: YqjF family protein [Persicimonas sp.]